MDLESLFFTQLVGGKRKVEEEAMAELTPPVGIGNVTLCNDICQRCDRSYRRETRELTGLLRNSEMKALLDAHDVIAGQYLDGVRSKLDAPWKEIKEKEDPSSEWLDTSIFYGQPIRVIGLRKTPGKPLGVTVEESEGSLVVARILSGGMIDKMGLLKVGDVILEVNSNDVTSPHELQQEISKAHDSLQLKVMSSPREKYEMGFGECFMRALFTYNPALDNLLPCKEIGLEFQVGDILHILDQSDPNWWQAKRLENDQVGLIPSRDLEEKRAAFVRPEADLVHSIGVCGTRISRRTKRCVYAAKQNSDFDLAELDLYEEVARMAPFRRRTLVLAGTNEIGRRALKSRLLNSDQQKYGTVIPETTRPPREGEERMNNYIFVSRGDFEESLRSNRFLEFWEEDGHFYGTSFDSVRDVIRKGKLCIVECGPCSLKYLHNSPEFMPYVVFLAKTGATGRTQQPDPFHPQHPASFRDDDVGNYLGRPLERFFDLIAVNEDTEATFHRVVHALDALSTDDQWVPVTWVY